MKAIGGGKMHEYPAKDEVPHTPGKQEYWQESVVLIWWDPKNAVGGYYRIGHEPNRDGGITSIWAAVHTPGESHYRNSVQPMTAADKFKLVDDGQQATVIVPYLSDGPDATDTAPLIARLRRGDTDRWLLRKLQRYTVTVRQNMVNKWQARGDVHELQPGLYLLVDELRYDRRYGLKPEGQAIDAASLVP